LGYDFIVEYKFVKQNIVVNALLKYFFMVCLQPKMEILSSSKTTIIEDENLKSVKNYTSRENLPITLTTSVMICSIGMENW